MRSRAALLTGAVLALGPLGAVSLPAPAGAQTCPSTYAPSPCVTLTLSATIVAPGVAITITGSGFLAFSVIVITFHTAPVTLATVRADGNGDFSATVTIPASATPGSHVIEASGTGANGQPLTLTTPVTIASAIPVSVPSASRPTSTAGQLPFTGANLALTGGTGGVLVLGGAAAIVASRRRVAHGGDRRS